MPSYRIPPVFERPEGAEYSFGDFVHARLDANLRNWLLVTPGANPAMLQIFRDRDREPRRDLVPWAGEFAGKYLISAVQALRLSRDEGLKRHLERFVADLIATQAADGYFGPFPSSEEMTGPGRWDLWGQYHVLLGLYEWYRATGEEAALVACRRCADKFCRVFLEGEKRVVQVGSEEMNESAIHIFTLLYRETGEARYHQLAREIEKDWEVPPSGDYVRTALAGQPFYATPKPRWEGLHGIQAIAELYFLTGEAKYRQAYAQIWWSILEGDRHNTGGFSSGEQATGNPYDPRAIETCCTIAWTALTQDFLRMTGDARAADELELSFYNGILGAQNPGGNWWTYDTPMDGEKKASAHDIVFQARAGSPELNCCSVNGPRGLGILSEWAVMQAEDGIVLNYYGPGAFAINLPSGSKVHLKQATRYPLDGKITLQISPAQGMERFALYLRIPGWSRRTEVKIGGQAVPGARPGSYLRLEREWSHEDKVEIVLDMATRLWVGEREAAGKASVYHGPLLLAYDPRFDIHDPTQLPSLDFSQPPTALPIETPDPQPLLLLRFPTTDGRGITLCDFASAGAAGNRYVSWLPAAGYAPAPFSRENPLRAVWP